MYRAHSFAVNLSKVNQEVVCEYNDGRGAHECYQRTQEGSCALNMPLVSTDFLLQVPVLFLNRRQDQSQRLQLLLVEIPLVHDVLDLRNIVVLGQRYSWSVNSFQRQG